MSKSKKRQQAERKARRAPKKQSPVQGKKKIKRAGR